VTNDPSDARVLEAFALHQQGRLDYAELIYRQVLLAAEHVYVPSG
jgi:hypothetical protein